MNRRLALAASLFIGLLVVGLVVWLVTHASKLVVLNPQGPIGASEGNLMLTATVLILVVVVPVFVLIFSIAWHYRAGNTTARYTPDWDTNRKLEALWWGIPMAIIATLATITWISTHDLDPYKPIASHVPPMTVQVVALQWKWLFIYPDLGIASVNLLELPTGTPVNFEITSDAPMNSFWIPQLGGQIYAMSGMSTRLSLQADNPGDYRGSSANLSGTGFADMNFLARAVSPAQFDVWVGQVKQAGHALDASAYNQLARPSLKPPVSTYASSDAGLYDEVVMKYMSSASGMSAL